MQYDKPYEWTETFKAISVPQPEADNLILGDINYLIRKRNTTYKGKVLIVSNPGKERGGMTIGFAELVSVKKEGKIYKYFFENKEQVIEFPCQKCGAKTEIWECYYTKDTIITYPKINIRRWLKDI